MHARLDGCLGKDRLDRLREAFAPVHAADQNVLQAALLQIGQHLRPEFGALGLLQPQAQHVAVTPPERRRELGGGVGGSPPTPYS